MMILPHKRPHAGFTLFELLLYMALATIMLGVMAGIGMHVLEARTKIRAQEEVRYNAFIVAELFERIVEGAYEVTIPLEGETGNTLAVSMHDPLKDPTILTIDEGVVTVTEGASAPVVLSGTAVEADGSFAWMHTDEEQSSVRLMLRMRSMNPENVQAYSASSTIYTAARIRYTP